MLLTFVGARWWFTRSKLTAIGTQVGGVSKGLLSMQAENSAGSSNWEVRSRFSLFGECSVISRGEKRTMHSSELFRVIFQHSTSAERTMQTRYTEAPHPDWKPGDKQPIPFSGDYITLTPSELGGAACYPLVCPNLPPRLTSSCSLLT